MKEGQRFPGQPDMISCRTEAYLQAAESREDAVSSVNTVETLKGNAMQRSNLVRECAIGFSMLLGVLIAAPAVAQLEVWEDYEVSDAIWSLTMVKLDPGTQDIYLEGLKSTWVAANEVAKSLGHVEYYSIHANQAVAPDAFDLLLVIKFPSTEMMAPSRERYNAFMEAWGQENMDASNEKVLELYNEIREIQGEYLTREITIK
ncbi:MULTISPECIES: hypothetical protein [unclassified Wenzhouxiangella]|uniref:hypothetical protein n=1 Tax=unclassified Wenzhouxiangella TaxID=2613841 RepID=UPI0011C0EDD8|nr:MULTISPECIES: hypothetical protein [unclassified Wenzhouxiangella]